jgi:molybdate-binding protein/DNA-binding XRE family transcriptional regulator
VLRSRIREVRAGAGRRQQELAAAAGISRQTLSSIEAGRTAPSTEVALRLSRALGVAVEDLFELAAPRESVTLAGPRGRRVAVAEVRGRLVAHALPPESFAAADALLGKGNRVEPLRDDLRAPLLVLGCDPALGLLVSRVAARGVRMTWLHAPSEDALRSLARGEAHVAGLHLRDTAGAIRAAVPQAARVGLARWELGLAVAKSNPLGIRGVRDLHRVRIVNRERGAGARGLLDRLLRDARVPPSRVRGYDRIASGHLAVALAVALGAADAGVTTRAAALAHELSFVPLSDELFELAIPDDLLADLRVGRLLEALDAAPFRRELAALPGYSPAPKGVAHA